MIDNKTMRTVSETTHSIFKFNKKWADSHAKRWVYFADREPNFEDCIYAIKTRELFDQLEKSDYFGELKELRDQINLVLADLENS